MNNAKITFMVLFEKIQLEVHLSRGRCPGRLDLGNHRTEREANNLGCGASRSLRGPMGRTAMIERTCLHLDLAFGKPGDEAFCFSNRRDVTRGINGPKPTGVDTDQDASDHHTCTILKHYLFMPRRKRSVLTVYLHA